MPIYEVIFRHALVLAFWTTLPVVGVALVGGLVIGVLQSLTQINDSTFSLAPKLAAALFILWLLGAWMLRRDAGFASTLIRHAGALVARSWS